MTTLNIQQLALARVESQIAWWEGNIERTTEFLDAELDKFSRQTYQSGISLMTLHLSGWKALRVAIEMQPLQAFDGDVSQDFFEGFTYALNQMHELVGKEMGITND